MTWKKRIISIALCLCALLCAASVRADAEDAHTNHLVCGGTTGTTCTHAGDKHTSNVTWTAWDGTTTINKDFFGSLTEKYLYLSQDVTLPNFLTIANGKTLYLCLNGHNLKMSRNRVIDIDGGTFILCNCKDTGAITQADNNSKGMGVGLSQSGKFTMYGGSITGNKVGVNVGSGCTFTMYGGSITQNAAGDDSGGGVYVYKNGTFTMYNGEISHNSAYIGGGVYNKGKFTMSNGMIVNNTAKSDGGGVHNDGGEFTMSDGEISGNSSENFAGGVRNLGKFTMSGGTITGNTAANNGGGVHNYNGTFNISGNVTITGNKKGSVANNVYLPAGSTITLAGALGENASIHVTTSRTPGSIPITGGVVVANKSWASTSNFIYDNNNNNNNTSIATKTYEDNGTDKVQLVVCKHNYNNVKWTPNTDASTGHWRKCNNCDTTQTAAHTEKIDAAVEPTCTATGLTEGKHCSVCGAVIVAQTTVPAKAHDWGTQWISDDSDKNHHWHKCNNCNAIDTTSKASHTWDDGEVTTPATCTTDGVKTFTCTATGCGATKTETIGAKGHDFSVRQYGENDHWMKCSRCDATDTKEAHSGGTATCTKKAKCEVCGQPHGDFAAHVYDTTKWVKADENEHGRECTKCHAIGEKTAHSYAEVVDDAYKVSAATCTDRAVYYKSCVCGEKGTTTFESGNSLGHDFSVRRYDENDHWMKCSRCDAIDAKAAHSGGAASCTEKAKCEVCGQPHGDLKAHDFANGPYRYYGEQHWKKCANCDATDTKEAHSGGKASCTEKAKCEVCGQPHGGLKVHDFANGPYQYDGEQHWKKCADCDATDTKVNHSGGTASCTKKAECSVCGQEYGEKLAHSYTVQEYDEIQHWYKCANCTATTEPVAHTDFTAWKSDRSGHWHECSTCGYKTAVTAHTPDRDKATETEAKVCKDCDWVIDPATHPNHTWVLVAEKPATCNAAGEREHYKCTCGRTSFKNGDTYDINEDASVLTIEKNSANHTGAPDSKWLSDSENHWQEYTCCHAKANEAAHSGGAATCTAQAVCQVCGRAYGAALGHDWGAWKVTTPATKDAPGVETRTCTHDKTHTQTRSIPKLSTTVYTVSEDTKIAQIEAKVDGLDKILDSEENKQLAKDGKSVGVSLTVKNTASSGVSEKIKEKLAGSNLVGLRLELTVEKTVTENGAVVERKNIPDTGVLLKTTITLPAELQGKSGYVVYRLHGDAVHVLTETPNANGEFITVSADKTQITICARLYSEYVIAYQTGGSSGGGYHPVNPTPVKATSANTGDAGVLLYGVTAALSLTGTAWLGVKGKKR